MYFRHTIGRPGGGKMEALRDLRQVSTQPEEPTAGGILPTLPLCSLLCCSAGGRRWGGWAVAVDVAHCSAACRFANTLALALTPRPSPPPPPPLLAQRIPERILEKCVKGMLPKGRIASPLFNHLKASKTRRLGACWLLWRRHAEAGAGAARGGDPPASRAARWPPAT